VRQVNGWCGQRLKWLLFLFLYLLPLILLHRFNNLRTTYLFRFFFQILLLYAYLFFSLHFFYLIPLIFLHLLHTFNNITTTISILIDTTISVYNHLNKKRNIVRGKFFDEKLEERFFLLWWWFFWVVFSKWRSHNKYQNGSDKGLIRGRQKSNMWLS
jgi:hypothetical protein